jgi:hypothetical protein
MVSKRVPLPHFLVGEKGGEDPARIRWGKRMGLLQGVQK